MLLSLRQHLQGGTAAVPQAAPVLGQHLCLPACRDPAECLKVLDVNVVGPLRVTQKLLPLLLKQNTRKVVNISSMLGSISATRWADMCCPVTLWRSASSSCVCGAH